MAKKKNTPKEEVFFVGVQEPVEVRRNILEVSRDMVQFLQQHQKLTTVRNEKTEAIKRLHQDVKELRTLINKLKHALPKTKLRIKIHDERKVFKCNKCGQELASEKNLKEHLKTHVQHRKPKKKKIKRRKTRRKAKKKTVKKVAKKIIKKSKLMKATKTKIPKPEVRVKLTPPAPQPRSEVEKLESELADIENKLGRLS